MSKFREYLEQVKDKKWNSKFELKKGNYIIEGEKFVLNKYGTPVYILESQERDLQIHIGKPQEKEFQSSMGMLGKTHKSKVYPITYTIEGKTKIFGDVSKYELEKYIKDIIKDLKYK